MCNFICQYIFVGCWCSAMMCWVVSSSRLHLSMAQSYIVVFLFRSLFNEVACKKVFFSRFLRRVYTNALWSDWHAHLFLSSSLNWLNNFFNKKTNTNLVWTLWCALFFHASRTSLNYYLIEFRVLFGRFSWKNFLRLCIKMKQKIYLTKKLSLERDDVHFDAYIKQV